MTTTTIAENLRQYKSRLLLTVEQILLTFTSSTNLVGEVKNVSPNWMCFLRWKEHLLKAYFERVMAQL